MIFSRRSLVATAISGTVAWLGEHLSFLTIDAGRAYHSELIALCSDLRCPGPSAKPACSHSQWSESTRSSLARTILADVRSGATKPFGFRCACAGHQ